MSFRSSIPKSTIGGAGGRSNSVSAGSGSGGGFVSNSAALLAASQSPATPNRTAPHHRSAGSTSSTGSSAGNWEARSISPFIAATSTPTPASNDASSPDPQPNRTLATSGSTQSLASNYSYSAGGGAPAGTAGSSTPQPFSSSISAAVMARPASASAASAAIARGPVRANHSALMNSPLAVNTLNTTTDSSAGGGAALVPPSPTHSQAGSERSVSTISSSVLNSNRPASSGGGRSLSAASSTQSLLGSSSSSASGSTQVVRRNSSSTNLSSLGADHVPSADEVNKNFKVVVRIRPPLPRELNSNSSGGSGTSTRPFQNIVHVTSSNRGITVSENPPPPPNDGSSASAAAAAAAQAAASLLPVHRFTFDYVYDQDSAQSVVYAHTARAAVLSTLEGYNATVLAYGQTGSGKTFTMEGFDDSELRGIIPRSVEEIFDYIHHRANPQARFLVRASYLQIYNEVISDLLKPERTNLLIREDKIKGVFVEGLSEWVVRSPKEVYGLIKRGSSIRATGATRMNEISSRSHALFIIIVEQNEMTSVKPGSTTTTADGKTVTTPSAAAATTSADGKTTNPDPATTYQTFKVGKLNLVDLAGSERVRISGASGRRLEESKHINQSLAALGNVIAALTERTRTPSGSGGAGGGMMISKPRSHIPYRDSKLTRILEDSLGGNCKTTMMAMMSPAAEAFLESLSTLKFANRAKNIKNEARVNEDLDEKALLRRYEAELKKLRHELQTRSRNVVDKRKLLEVEEQRRRAEQDKMAALMNMEQLSRDLMSEKTQKKKLEERIKEMNSQLLGSGVGSLGAAQVQESPAFKQALASEHARIRKAYEKKVNELEKEREVMEEEKVQTYRYKQLLLKQRDIMIQLTARLNERDQSILILQEELDAYDAHQRLMEDALDQKTATLIHLQKLTMQYNPNAAAAGGTAANGATSPNANAAALLLHAQIKEVLASATGGVSTGATASSSSSASAAAPTSGVLKKKKKESSANAGGGAGGKTKVTFRLPPEINGQPGDENDDGDDDDATDDDESTPATAAAAGTEDEQKTASAEDDDAQELVVRKKPAASNTAPPYAAAIAAAAAGSATAASGSSGTGEWKVQFDRASTSLQQKERELAAMANELSEIRADKVQLEAFLRDKFDSRVEAEVEARMKGTGAGGRPRAGSATTSTAPTLSGTTAAAASSAAEDSLRAELSERDQRLTAALDDVRSLRAQLAAAAADGTAPAAGASTGGGGGNIRLLESRFAKLKTQHDATLKSNQQYSVALAAMQKQLQAAQAAAPSTAAQPSAAAIDSAVSAALTRASDEHRRTLASVRAEYESRHASLLDAVTSLQRDTNASASTLDALQRTHTVHVKERAALKIILETKMKTLVDSIANAAAATATTDDPNAARTKRQITVLQTLLDASIKALKLSDEKLNAATPAATAAAGGVPPVTPQPNASQQSTPNPNLSTPVRRSVVGLAPGAIAAAAAATGSGMSSPTPVSAAQTPAAAAAAIGSPEADSARGGSKTPERVTPAAAKPTPPSAASVSKPPSGSTSTTAAGAKGDKKVAAATKKDAKSDRKSKKTKDQEKAEAEAAALAAEEAAKLPPPEPTEGSGVFEFANGARYNGEWKTVTAISAVPVPGATAAPNADAAVGGIVYVVKRKIRHGRGVFTWNGDEYTGEWTDDQLTGRGVYRFSSGGVYDGALVNGKFHGDGRYQFPSGGQYMGQWNDNRMNGEGCFVTASGDRYRGTFHNDRFLNKDGTWTAPAYQTDRKL